LQGADIVKFIKSSRIKWYGHVERIQNQRMPKLISAATIEATMEIGRPGKRWKDVVEEDLNITGIKTGVRRPGIVGNGGRLCCKPRSTTDCSA
jgi:hypothetical protein